MHTFDLNLEHITKVEGSAALELRVRDNKVEHVHFKITEHKRFFTEAIKGKPIAALPQLLARICGTCSNAHLMASIEACEHALDITPSEQTMLLRHLTIHGLIIRDHALHLYLFSMPDIFGKDAFLDFDEDDPIQHQLLHDAFEIKAAGNHLAMLVAGRSVHALHPTIGGFLRFPEKEGIAESVKKLEAIRPAVLRLIDVFKNAPFHFDRNTNFMALTTDKFRYLDGWIETSTGEKIPEEKYREHVERVVLPYSQASAYKHNHDSYMVGSLARINLAKNRLHPRTKETLGALLDMFPSTDIYHNNLAQAIEIMHSIDDAIEILTTNTFTPEPIIKVAPKAGVGIGVIEAPRGTLYHKVVIDDKGIVLEGEVIVPTGQNQVNIEEDIWRLTDELLAKDTPKETIACEIEKLIRAYDPCMSCASHFLKIDWQKA